MAHPTAIATAKAIANATANPTNLDPFLVDLALALQVERLAAQDLALVVERASPGNDIVRAHRLDLLVNRILVGGFLSQTLAK